MGVPLLGYVRMMMDHETSNERMTFGRHTYIAGVLAPRPHQDSGNSTYALTRYSSFQF